MRGRSPGGSVLVKVARRAYTGRMSHDIFISYAHADKGIADEVCAVIEENGLRCWIAPRDVLPGKEYAEAIVDAIAGSRAMVLVFSARSNESPQVKREVERAVSKGVKIVPFRIESVTMTKSLEYYLSDHHWLDALTPPVGDHARRLSETLKVLLAGGSSSRAAASVVASAPSGPTGSPEKAPRKYLLWAAVFLVAAGVAARVPFRGSGRRSCVDELRLREGLLERRPRVPR